MNIVNSVNLKTDRQVGIVIPTALRHDFTPFLLKLENKMIQNGMKPLFFIRVMPFPEVEKGISVISSQFPQADISVSYGPVGRRLQEGFSAASKKTDVMFFTCDDFDHLLGSKPGAGEGFLPGFAKKIGEGNDVLLGSWDSVSTSYLPYPMWLNEAGISVMVTYARPDHPLQPAPIQANENRAQQMIENFISISKQNGTWTQVYIGVQGMVSGKWDGIQTRMHQLFGDDAAIPYLDGTGTEAGIPLSSFDLNLKVGSYKLHKRFEHSINVERGSEAEAQFAQSRKHQFIDGALVVLYYVSKLIDRAGSPNAPDAKPGSKKWKARELARDLTAKFTQLRFFWEKLHNEIEKAPFRWPDHQQWPRASKWNTEIRTGL